MSILKLNNKIITLGGSVVNYTPPPIYGVDFANMATTSGAAPAFVFKEE